MSNTKLQDFKESLRQGMIENFERDGCLLPIMFFLKDGMPVIGEIPFELLETPERKDILAGTIRKICQQPNVLAAGLIIEASGVKMDDDSEMANLVKNGSVRISELKESQDIIVMVFSTPEGEELIAYCVDIKNKTVGEMFSGEETKGMGGIFSNFFSWTKN